MDSKLWGYGGKRIEIHVTDTTLRGSLKTTPSKKQVEQNQTLQSRPLKICIKVFGLLLAVKTGTDWSSNTGLYIVDLMSNKGADPEWVHWHGMPGVQDASPFGPHYGSSGQRLLFSPQTRIPFPTVLFPFPSGLNGTSPSLPISPPTPPPSLLLPLTPANLGVDGAPELLQPGCAGSWGQQQWEAASPSLPGPPRVFPTSPGEGAGQGNQPTTTTVHSQAQLSMQPLPKDQVGAWQETVLVVAGMSLLPEPRGIE